jgi:hypothetical protein
MSEVNTVMHEGNVYEFNKPYMFSNADEADPLDWEHGTLIGILDSTSYKFKTPYNSYVYIKEMEAKDLGTITPAPIEPTMAELFVFDIRDISLCGDVKTADQMIAKGWVKK